MKQIILLGVLFALLAISLPCTILAQTPPPPTTLPWDDTTYINAQEGTKTNDIPYFGSVYVIGFTHLGWSGVGAGTLFGDVNINGSTSFYHTLPSTSGYDQDPISRSRSTRSDWYSIGWVTNPGQYYTGFHTVDLDEDD